MMRTNIILAAVAVFLATALLVVYVSMDTRIKQLETELSLMDSNLKQFAMPMDNLRQDIAAIYVELDAMVLNDRSDGSRRLASSRSGERRNDTNTAPVTPAVQPAPSGAVHYGGVSNLNDTTVVDSTGTLRQRTTFAEPVDEED